MIRTSTGYAVVIIRILNDKTGKVLVRFVENGKEGRVMEAYVKTLRSTGGPMEMSAALKAAELDHV